MKTSVISLLAAVAMLVASGPADAQLPGKEWKNCQPLNSKADITYFQPGGPNDVVTVWAGGQTCEGPNRQKRTFRHVTLVGQGLFPPDQYERAAPYSLTNVFVLRHDGRWATYRFGEGEIAGAPLHGDVRQLAPLGACPMPGRRQNTLPRAVVSLGAPDAQGRREGAIYNLDGEPVVIKGLGGPGIAEPFVQHNDMIIARWIDDAGVERSRLYSLGGQPLSPVVGRIERWALHAIDEENYKVCNFTEELHLFFAGPSLDRDPAGDFFGPLLVPIGSNGEPAALPDGAVGVFPVLSYDRSEVLENDWGWRSTLAWGVVFPTAEGFEFTMTGGSLAQALAEAPDGVRYEEITRLGSGWNQHDRKFDNSATIIARSPDGKWRGRSYILFNAVGAPADSEEAAEYTARRAFQDGQTAEYYARNARSALVYVAALDAGTACNMYPPLGLGRELVERHARACPQAYGLTERNWLRDMGFPDDILRGVDYAMRRAEEKAAAAHAEMLANTAAYVPPVNWETALRLGGDAWVKQIQARSESWLLQRQQEYLADWNRAQRAY